MMAWQFLAELFGIAPDAPGDEVARLFLSGYSIPRIATMLQPGVGGPALIEAQRDVEDELRHYVEHVAADNEALAGEVLALRRQIATMEQASR